MGSVGPALLASHFLRSGYGRGSLAHGAEEKDMEARIKELIARIERLEQALRASSDDEDFVHQLMCVVAGYEARVEYLRSVRVVEHFLG